MLSSGLLTASKEIIQSLVPKQKSNAKNILISSLLVTN